MATLTVMAKSPAYSNSRTKADTVLQFVVRHDLSAAAIARTIDHEGRSAVDRLLGAGWIMPALGNRPGVVPVAGHGVVVRYKAYSKTFRA